MTIDPSSGGVVFDEIGLALDASLTRTQFGRLATASTALPRVRHDPTFRYQLPVVPQPNSSLYVVLRFHYERLESMNLFHHAERFDAPVPGQPADLELARKTFHEEWLTARHGLACQRYRWGEVYSVLGTDGQPSSILLEYAKPNAWRTAGRTAGRMWGAALGPRPPR